MRRFVLQLTRLIPVSAAALLLCALLPSTAWAQTPYDGPGIEGPWMDIFQIFWFTNADDREAGYAHQDKGTTYAQEPAMRFDYGKNRHPKCYYYDDAGPDADWINALFSMMSCRMGLIVGMMTWFGVGIALMALAWAGFMWVVDSNAAGERMAALRDSLTGPLVGLTLLFVAYPVAKFIYGVIRLNFETYIIGTNFWTGGVP